MELWANWVLLHFFFFLDALWGALKKPPLQPLVSYTRFFLYLCILKNCVISQSICFWLRVPDCSKTPNKAEACLINRPRRFGCREWIPWAAHAVSAVLSSTARRGGQEKLGWNETCVILWNTTLQNQDLLETAMRLGSLLNREKLFLSQHIAELGHFLFLATIKRYKEICWQREFPSWFIVCMENPVQSSPVHHEIPQKHE